MIDLPTMADALLANFCTIRLPASEDRLAPSVLTPANWSAVAKARFAERRAATAYRDRLRRQLVEHDHQWFLHDTEPDPEGGWRLHFFFADDAAMSLLHQLADGLCGPGDPVDFDPQEFVVSRLSEWANRNQ